MKKSREGRKMESPGLVIVSLADSTKALDSSALLTHFPNALGLGYESPSFSMGKSLARRIIAKPNFYESSS